MKNKIKWALYSLLATNFFIHSSFASLKIRSASTLPASQQETLQKDFAALENMSFTSSDSDMKSTMGLQTINASSLIKWLEDRVQVVVDENYNIAKNTKVAPSEVVYPSANISPAIEEPLLPPPPVPAAESNQKPMVVMSNVGASIYNQLKSLKKLGLVTVPGVGDLPVSSPRIGIIKVGPGLFKDRVSTSPLSAGNTISRLSTFFHESRHSDGNGISLSFSHANCPPGHDYEGYYACDRNLNGPYTVGALITKNMLENCKNCDVKEKERLKLIALDSFSRIIKVTPQFIGADKTEITQLSQFLFKCDDLNAKLNPQNTFPINSGECADSKTIAARNRVREIYKSYSTKPGIASQALDDSPEGKRM